MRFALFPNYPPTLKEMLAYIQIDPLTSCWNWQLGKDGRGYGQLNICGKTYNAHRLIWIIVHGEIPSDVYICHRCNNRSCINYVSHLYAGNALTNMQDISTHEKYTARKGRGTGKRKLRGLKGSKHGNAILTEEMVREIRQHCNLSGKEIEELSKNYPVSALTVRNIYYDRERWKHIK